MPLVTMPAQQPPTFASALMSSTTLRMLVVVTLCTVPLTVLTVLLVVSAALPTHCARGAKG